MWKSARSRTGCERSSDQPPSEIEVGRRRRGSCPSCRSPPRTWNRTGAACRSASCRGRGRAGSGRAGRVFTDASATIAANALPCVSLPAETAPHPRRLDDDLVAGLAQHLGDDRLDLRRVLGRRADEDRAHLARLGPGRLRLQVEVLLAAEGELALEAQGRLGQRAPRRRPRASVCGGVWKLPSAMASLIPTSGASTSYSTATLAAPRRGTRGSIPRRRSRRPGRGT